MLSTDLVLRDALVLHLVAPAHLAEDPVLVPQHPDTEDTVLPCNISLCHKM